jgi:hypothetical protein
MLPMMEMPPSKIFKMGDMILRIWKGDHLRQQHFRRQGRPRLTDQDVDEEIALLHNGHTLWPLHPRKSLIRSIQAFMICQPQPIPLVNKILPSTAYTIIIIGFIALNIFYTFFHINFNIFELFVFADAVAWYLPPNSLCSIFLLQRHSRPGSLQDIRTSH